MTRGRLLALAASVTVAGLVATTTSPAASARPASGRGDDRCLSRDPIPVAGLAAAARSGCSLVGRMVTDGRVSVAVPPAGISVSGDGVGMHGDVRGLTVTNTGTALRAVRSGGAGGGGNWYLVPLTTSTTSMSTLSPTTGTTGTLTTTGTLGPSSMTSMTSLSGPITTSLAGSPRRASTAACRDRTFNLEHHRWTSRLGYRINLGHMPSRFGKATVVRQIRAANSHMRKGVNSCGRPQLKTPAARYLGRTHVKPDIKAAGPTCGDPNRANVVGFGNLPGGLLGWTCYWYLGRKMIAADMLIDNGPSLATKLPQGCTDRWDFEGTVTHEWGHAYGLAHTGSGHPNLTMQHELKPCSTYARTLGLGDWLGMKKMYGAH